MPIITVETWPLEKETKPTIIKEITNIFTKLGIPAEAVTVLIHETQMEDWANGGVQHSVKFRDLKQ